MAATSSRQPASGTWQPVQQVPAADSSDGPALAVFGGRLYAAFMGSEGDTNLWWSSFDGFNWAPQQRISDSMASSNSPSLAAFQGRLYMAWRGTSPDVQLYYSSV